MQYIFLDLEWNNTYSKEHKKNINEIIEIGAVKLDEDFQFISRFDCIIRSKLTKRLGSRFKNLTHISNDLMKQGVSFQEAVDRYIKWAGKGNVTVTWSNSDLYAIIDNYSAFLKDRKIDMIDFYLDLQKFYQSVSSHENNNQISLKVAAEEIGVPLDEISLHRASDDSEITAKIFKKINSKGDFKSMIVDTSPPEFYDRLRFRPFMITDINSPELEGVDISFKCKVCGENAVSLGKWTVKNNQLYSDFKCENCKYKFVGRLCIKKYYDEVKVKKAAISVKRKPKPKPKEEKVVV